MKQTIIIKDINGKARAQEFNYGSRNILVAQLSNRPQVFKNKKSYTRKEKHKGAYYENCY